MLAIVYELAKARSHLSIPTCKFQQAFQWLSDEPVLPSVTFLNRDATLSIGYLDTFPITDCKSFSEQDTQIVFDNCPVEITLNQHS